jgi:hypothetical protein
MKMGGRQQAGMVLYALLFGLLGFSGYMAYAQGSARHARLMNERDQHAAMALAREALIARAVNDANRPGSLPCPAALIQHDPSAPRPGDGQSEMLAGNHCPSLIGRLPWSTLDIPQPLDDNLNTLWYVLAPGLRDHPSASPINSDTSTGLSLNGQDEIAALIIRPGPPLPGQQRPSNEPADYLEASLSNGSPRDFRTAPKSNDSILSISRSSLMAAVELRVASQVRDCLSAHARQTGRYPWPAPMSATPGEGRAGSRFGRVPLTQPENSAGASETTGNTNQPASQTVVWASPACDFLSAPNSWWHKGQWSDSVFYQVADPMQPDFATLHIAGQSTQSLVVIAAGARIGSQQRTSNDIADYLEGKNAHSSRNGNAEAPSAEFDIHQRRPDHNDQIAY